MKRAIFFGGLVLWALAAGAEARDWGFDKDTVYEWKAGGDTVRLVNSGADTLRLDSVFVEALDSSSWGNVGFYHETSTQSSNQSYNLNQFTHPSIKLENLLIPGGQSDVLRYFRIADAAPTAKLSGASLMEGDTVTARLRIKSSGSEYDTLLIKGTFDVGVYVRIPFASKLFQKNSVINRDIRGRAVASPNSWPVLNLLSD